MDRKDEKILVELTLNSRIPFNHLARKVGVSREVAMYRVNRLVKEKIIANFYPLINIEPLGYIKTGCWIQLKGISSEKEKEFFKYIVSHPFITYVGSVIGKWNVAFDILSKDKIHLSEILQEIEKEAGNYLENYVITNGTTEQETFPTKIMGAPYIYENKILFKKLKIDELDKKILFLLSNNSRIEYLEIANKLKVSPNTIKYRIINLEKSGTIEGYTIALNHEKLGYEFYNIQIKLDSELNYFKLKKFLRAYPKISYFYKYLGHENWDMDIGVFAKNSFELREIIIDLRKEFEGVMKIQDIYTTLEVLKSDIAPTGLFE